MKKLSNTSQLIIILLFFSNIYFVNGQTQEAVTLFEFSHKGFGSFIHFQNSIDFKKLGKKAIKQRLDSVDLDQYDSVTNTWNNNERAIFEYDNKGNCVLIIDLFWDSSLQMMINKRKSTFDFDKNANQILNEYYNWDDNNKEWDFVYKEEYVFDNFNNKLAQINYNLNTDNNTVEASYKSNYYYIDNKLNYRLDSNYNIATSKWSIINKTNYTLNSNGNIVQEIVVWWDKTNNSWTNSNKNFHTFDANGNVTISINYNWNGGTNDWRPTNKIENTYNNDNDNTSQIGYYRDNTTNTWTNSTKDIFIYNINGDTTQRIYYNWNLDYWEIQFDATYTFNTNYLKSALVTPFLSRYKHMLLGGLSQQFKDGILVSKERGTAYYSPININGLNTIESTSIKVFPNPTNGLVNIDFENSIKVLKVTISDIFGKEIKQFNFENRNVLQLNISELSNGIYFLNLIVNDQNTVYKIIKNE